MSIEMHHLIQRKWIIALVVIVVFLIGIVYLVSKQNDALTSMSEMQNTSMKADDTADTNYAGLSFRQNMLATTAVVFDKENPKLVYIPAIDTNEDGSQAITESSLFETPYASYDFLLHSTELSGGAGSYVTDYLSLAVTEHVPTGDVEVTYTDRGVDGVLDAAYVDGVLVTDSSLFAAAQDQYTAELVVSRNYLLGLTTVNVKK